MPCVLRGDKEYFARSWKECLAEGGKRGIGAYKISN
jgi:hypothetical protein